MAGAANVLATVVLRRPAEAADRGHRDRGAGREPRVRQRLPGRRRPDDARRHHGRGRQHRRRGPAGARRRDRAGRRGQPRLPDRDLHPDRRRAGRPRPAHRRRDGLGRPAGRGRGRGRGGRRGGLADAAAARPAPGHRLPGRGPAQRQREELGRDAGRPDCSCASSSPRACRGPTSTSPARRSTTERLRLHTGWRHRLRRAHHAGHRSNGWRSDFQASCSTSGGLRPLESNNSRGVLRVCYCPRPCAGPSSPASGSGSRPWPRRRAAWPVRRAKSAAARGLSTRRRVHSPSWATSTIVVSVTAVRGSRKPSTPDRLVTNSSRCRRSSDVAGPRRAWSVLRAPAEQSHGSSRPPSAGSSAAQSAAMLASAAAGASAGARPASPARPRSAKMDSGNIPESPSVVRESAAPESASYKSTSVALVVPPAPDQRYFAKCVE